ncbi:NAD(+) synthetase [Campylobacter sp. MIT 99-7217]|uniref:NAD+ synthase n=1 Tax=Campylobacter sp. MIT 99-7217 TaxID=535091 RepID=UPI00115977D9|nr:NAD+ synthase [Campylobacter sp. MIT 99-7217]TQR34643.1 NAD(+) synthetase [Campylobacter sp. MIT 99-7217]
MNYEILEKKILNFIIQKVQNAHAKGVIFGLSGGIDSALVASLCVRALKQDCFALLMPTDLSDSNNLKDAIKLCESLNLKHKIINIQEILDTFIKQSQTPDKLRIGNLAARVRMSLLYDYSALLKFLVVGTSNKSELLLGYGTIYGDLACAFNPIGSLYKSEIFEFASFLNLPKEFIQKAPSADLWEGQSDEKELGFTYARIDEVLKAFEVGDTRFLQDADQKLVAMIEKRMKANEFKRKMPEILNLKEF